MSNDTPSKLQHLEPGACMAGDLGTARLKKGRGKVLSDDDRRRRIRNRKRLALLNRKVGEDLLTDSFKRAKGV